jgi:hypothetical protein
MNKVIHLSTSADTANYTYVQVYAGALGTLTINGTPVTMAASSTIDIWIDTVVGVAGIYLIGFKKIGHPPTQING